MQVRLVLFVSALLAVFSLGAAAASASYVGDPAISSDHPFRLNPYTLEPGCFIPGRDPVDLDSHLDLTTLDAGQIARELHITVDHNSPVNVDQVLVPSAIDGYRIYNTFENTGRADDIGPNFTAVDLFAPDSNDFDGPDPLDKHDVIVCVSDHGSAQNEPYDQAASGSPVWAKNRPVLTPVVSALGVSAVEPLNTYKVGFGYTVDKWYSAPTFDGHSAFPAVTDPNAFGGSIPTLVRSTRVRTRASSIRAVSTTWTPRTRAGRACSPPTVRPACSSSPATPRPGRCPTTTTRTPCRT
jgi:hypothetical protein